MKLLKKYYNERIKTHNMPEFKELGEAYKRKVGTSMGFALYQFNDACKRFVKPPNSFS